MAPPTMNQELEEVIDEVNRIFFGLTVARDDLPIYWMGTLIFVVTFIYSFFPLLPADRGNRVVKMAAVHVCGPWHLR